MKELDLNEKLERAKKAVFKQAENLNGIEIKGHDFSKKCGLNEFIDNYKSTGMQASHLGKAIEIVKEMRKEKAKIFLAYTSNMVSSGLRDIIKWLVEHKHVHVLVTTAGGIEEDLIKCFKPFLLGNFEADGADLRKRGINRIGNIFVPNDRYCAYEDWINSILKEIYKKQKETNNVLCVSEFIKILGEKIDNKDSILYWAAKNDIPVFCPAITDGSTGDMIFFFKQENKDFLLDISKDIYGLNNEAINADKTGIIILGEGIIKHAVCNANLFRDGTEYAVYINSQSEFDGSDSGASPREAISWGKIKVDGKRVKVHADATLVFPLLVQASFANDS